jgi:hypothetical protein
MTYINRTHVSHFDVEVNTEVVASDRLVQLTGTFGALLRLVAYLGLEKAPASFRDGSYVLTDGDGRGRGQLHRMDRGNHQLVIDRVWFEAETA